MKEIQKEYMKLLKQANEITGQIPERIRDWEIFKYRVDKFSIWLGRAQEELKKITCFYLFLTDFKPVLERYKVSMVIIRKYRTSTHNFNKSVMDTFLQKKKHQ